MSDTARIIKELREDRDLTQKEVASVIGTTQQHYSKYENGEHDIPLRAALLLADYYNISMDFLTSRTRVKNKFEDLNRYFVSGYTVGELVAELSKLSDDKKAKIIEYLEFLNSK